MQLAVGHVQCEGRSVFGCVNVAGTKIRLWRETETDDLHLGNERAPVREVLIIRVQDNDLRRDFAGKYFPHEWVRTDILRQSSEEMKIMDKQMDKEIGVERYNQPILDPNDPNGIENVELGPPMPPAPIPTPTSVSTSEPRKPSYKKTA